MSSDLLDNASYGLKHGNNVDKGDSTDINFTMDRLKIQHSRPDDNHEKDDDDDDDNEIIGNILQSPTDPTMSLSSGPPTIKNDQQMQQRVQSPSIHTDSNWTTTTTLTTNETTDNQKTDTDDDDLRQAMQLTWNALDAVLSDDGIKSTSLGTTHQDGKKRDTKTKPQDQPTEQHTTVSSLPAESTTTTLTTTARIYIADFKKYKTIQLTNLLTTAMVIQYLKRKELLDFDDDWTMFEIAAEHGIERPLRLWEIVSDVTSCWPKITTNTLLIKKYGLYKTLTMDSLREKTLLVHSWLNIEYKKEKWQKRYCFIKDHIIYHANDSKYSNSAALCHLGSFDVYTLLQPCSTSPTPFVFALKIQDRISTHGKNQGYVRLFTAEDQSCLETWVLGIRQEKSILQYRKHPNRVKNPLTVFKPSTGSTPTAPIGQGGNPTTLIQRHKSLKLETTSSKIDTSIVEQPKSAEPPSRRITDAEIKRRMSKRRTGTIRHREHQHHATACDTEDITNGSKAASSPITTDEGNSSNTLIQIDDKFKFSKGSLLDKDTTTVSPPTTATPSSPQQQHLNDGKSNLSRMSSIRTAHSGDSQQRSRTLSQRRKGRDGGGQHQQQQSNTTTATTPITTTNNSSGKTVSMTSLTSGTTLLNLHHTPERFHTQTLLQRQLKPLLNFNQDIASVPRR